MPHAESAGGHGACVGVRGRRNLTRDNATSPVDLYGGKWHVDAFVPGDHGTSHISVVDAQRGAVAMTTTVNTGWGSAFISPSTGAHVFPAQPGAWNPLPHAFCTLAAHTWPAALCCACLPLMGPPGGGEGAIHLLQLSLAHSDCVTVLLVAFRPSSTQVSRFSLPQPINLNTVCPAPLRLRHPVQQSDGRLLHPGDGQLLRHPAQHGQLHPARPQVPVVHEPHHGAGAPGAAQAGDRRQRRPTHRHLRAAGAAQARPLPAGAFIPDTPSAPHVTGEHVARRLPLCLPAVANYVMQVEHCREGLHGYV